jgi:hypothetical protein
MNSVKGSALSGPNIADNNCSYDAGLDYVIDITGFTGTISAGLFD